MGTVLGWTPNDTTKLKKEVISDHITSQKTCSQLLSEFDHFYLYLFKMEGAAAFFQNDMKYTQFIDGTVNGEKFSVLNEGSSKYPHGDFWTHATCTSGKLPFSWKVLCHVLQYGVPMFGRYPNGLTHFTRESFPEGFTIDRTVRFEGMVRRPPTIHMRSKLTTSTPVSPSLWTDSTRMVRSCRMGSLISSRLRLISTPAETTLSGNYAPLVSKKLMVKS